jgi:putative FmdB family regulatory protein
MPTYEYQCDSCGHRFEQFQKITDDPLVACPACRKKKLRRLFGTGAAIMFKGSGFYQTDYRSSSYKAAAAKESKDGAAAKDAKPAQGDSASGGSKGSASGGGDPSPKADT